MRLVRGAVPLLLVVVSALVLAFSWRLVTRPFWYDEQWRAYHVALGPDQWSALPDANAPMAAGWLALEQVFGAVFGLREWALRLPAAIALLAVGPATYLLGRWWLRPLPAAVAGLLVVINGNLLIYGLQLKSYLIETALTPLLIHSWLCARRSRERGLPTWPAYLGMGGICLLSQPGVFVLAPLLLMDVFHSLRRGFRGDAFRRLGWPAVAGVIVVAQLVTVVRRQSLLVHNPYWQGEWIHGVGQALSQVGGYAANFVTLGLTEPDGNPTSPFRGSPLLSQPPTGVVVVIGVLVGALLVTGCLRGLRGDPGSRVMVIALLAALALITFAAALDVWPAGAVRVNLFLLPVLSLTAVTGAMALRVRVSWLAPITWGLAVVLVGIGVHWVSVVRNTADDPILLGDLRSEQAVQRTAAVKGDLSVVLVGRAEVDQYVKGNVFYTVQYSWGSPGYGISASATLTGDGWQPGAVTRWLDGRRPAHLFLSTYNRVADADTRGLSAELRHNGWCAVRSRTQRLTGTWTELVRCP